MPARQLALALLTGAFVAGCISPERRYDILSFLFDGVPEPGAVAIAVVDPPNPRTSERPRATRNRRAKPVIYRHDPDCDECHSDTEANRLEYPRQELCWECHDEDDFQGEFAHGPFAAGECVGCHSPHKSRFRKLLLSQRDTLCGRCHDEHSDPGLGLHREKRGDDCLDCHNPHAEARRYMLREGKAIP